MASEKKIERKQMWHRIGANIKYKREQMGLNMGQLANIVGITEAFQGLIERGERGTCLENVIFLSNFFSVSVEELCLTDLSATNVAEADDKDTEAYANLKNLVECLNENECKFVVNVIQEMRKHLY